MAHTGKGRRSRRIRDKMVRTGEMVEAQPGQHLLLTRDGTIIYDPNDFPGFTVEQIIAGLTKPAC